MSNPVKLWSGLSFAALLSIAINAHAESIGVYTSGSSLTDSCRTYMKMKRNGGVANAQDAYDSGFCKGMVYAVLDANAVHFDDIKTTDLFPRICITAGVNANDATEVVANYLDAHPEKRSLAAYYLVRQALATAWPCR
jgi:hypothetical protein